MSELLNLVTFMKGFVPLDITLGNFYSIIPMRLRYKLYTFSSVKVAFFRANTTFIKFINV